MAIIIAKKLIKVEQLEFPDIESLTYNRYTRIEYSDGSYMWYTGWSDFSSLGTKVYGQDNIDILELGYSNAGLKIFK